ncbi:MAG: ABC transporter permease subunit [Chloroflexota bacterium]|jgi:branched-chain amino acid transport system permease protein
MADSYKKSALILIIVAVALAAPAVFTSAYSIVLLNQALIFALIVLGLNFVYGFGGVFSLAQAAFWGIGAYTSALLTTDGNMSFPVGFLGAVLITSLFGLLLGIPTLKLRSHYLTLATLAFAESVRLVLMNTEWLTHGAQGIRGIPPATIGPLLFDNPYSFYYLNLMVVLVSVLFTLRFRRSRLGRALEATRDDELAAAASGVDVTYCRVLAFVLSAFFAGVAGSLWAHFSAYISPETFDLFATIRFVSMLLIGGAGTAPGPVVGALLLTFLPEWLRFLEAYYMAIYGLSIVLILVFAPKGLVGIAEQLVRKLQAREGDAGQGDGPHPRPLPHGERGHSNHSGLRTQDSGRKTQHTALDSQNSELRTQNPVLVTKRLTMTFGGLVAVRNVDLSIAEGSIHGLIGPNGSGKTTILNLVSGIYSPVAGEIILDGGRVDGLNPSILVSKGIARTFQNNRLFQQLTVLDNVKVASYRRSRAGLAGISLQTGRVVEEERRIEEEALKALQFMGLAQAANSLPGDLPYGKQRLVELARALASRPRLLLLDEPAAGMNMAEKQWLVRLVREINQKAEISVIVIEHDMKIISGLCHKVSVLNFGEVIAEGSPEEIRDDEAVIEAYLGRSRRRALIR